MYTPRLFEEGDPAVLHAFVERHPFGALVVRDDAAGLEVSHVPFLLDRSRGPLGRLRGHVARANPAWRLFDGRPALVVFSGPAGYVSPRWYESADQVPTWNYAVAHVHGTPRAFEDPGELRALLVDLAAAHERGAGRPWTLDELSDEALRGMLREIVGFTLEITSLEGKFKLSQNRAPKDRAGVLKGLRERGRPGDLDLLRLMEATPPGRPVVARP